MSLVRTMFVAGVACLVSVSAIATANEGAERRIAGVLEHFVKAPIAEQPITDHPELPGNTFSRLFNISLSARAYLQLMTDPSKDASSAVMLDRVAQYYLDNPEEIPDPDSTYWAGEYHAAALAKFGSNGTARKGAIPREAEVKMLKYMVSYVNFWSRLDKYDFSLKHQTYYYWNSENHWWQEIVTSWGYLLALKNDPDFKDTILADGKSVEEHYVRTVAYMKEHMRQRARKGFFTEISSGGYAGRMHAMYYMIYEISPDAELKSLATKSLDLWWAFWAEEQILGERGGGKVRHRKLRGLRPFSENHMVPAWFYLGVGARDLDYLNGLDDNAGIKANNYMAVLSDYRPAPFVTAILEDRITAPAYAIRQRRVGRSAGQDENAPPEIINEKRTPFDRAGIQKHKFYDFENSGVLKYSWVSPNFILGTNMRPPLDVNEWVAGSAQGWWHGLLIAVPGADYPERVVPTLIYPGDAMGEQYAVQSHGSLMARKLNDAWNKRQDNRKFPMGVFVSEGLKRRLVIDRDFIFIDSSTVWVAIRAVGTDFVLKDDALSRPLARAGSFYMLRQDSQPVIIEAAERADYPTFAAFQAAVRAASLVQRDGAYHYASLSGDTLSMFDDRSVPMINQQPINYSPAIAYQSRYTSSQWDTGVITITVGGQQHTLDFTAN